MLEAIWGSVRLEVILISQRLLTSWFKQFDAGATKVSAAIGIGTCYLKVDDNEFGVSRDGLVLMGERYVTSKYSHSDDMHVFPASFSFIGEALSSVSDVSLLEIVTKTHRRPNGYRNILKVILYKPEAICGSIWSGVFMYDFTRVVDELVFNSLDAGATKHAADERIRLEELQGKVLSGKMRTTAYLDSGQELLC